MRYPGSYDAPAMTTAADDRLAYASLARQAVHMDRRLPAGALHRLEALAPADGDGTVRLDFRIDEQGRAWVRGHVEQPVDAACQRCLERFARRLAVDFDLCIAPEGDDATELGAGVDVLVAEGDTLSIADIVEDELLLGLPERLCETDPCPHAPPLSFPAAGADETPAGSPFGVLSKLKDPGP
jgi:uncharacterized protein